MWSGLLAGIRWSVCMLKSHRSLCESFSRTGAGLCIYHLFVWSNWNFLHISQGITLPTQSCLALCSFCANLLHSLIMWLIVSSLLLLLLLLLFYYHYYLSLKFFTSASPGLFSVFWPFSIMLLFGWFPLGRQLPNLPGSLIIL